LIEPPPKKPGRITAGIVIAVIGVVILLLGVVLIFVLIYFFAYGTGEELDEWAQTSYREEGDREWFYLTIKSKTMDPVADEAQYTFEDCSRTIYSNFDIGSKGDSVLVEIEWTAHPRAEVVPGSAYRPITCRIPGILVIVLGLAVVGVGGLIAFMGNKKYQKELTDYRKSFTAGPAVSVEPPPLPTPPPGGAPPPGQPPPQAPPPPAQPPTGEQQPPPEGTPPEVEPAPPQEAPPPAEAEAPPAETPPMEEAPPAAEAPTQATEEEQPQDQAVEEESPPAEEATAPEHMVVACHACGGNIEVTTDERPVVLKCPGCGADAELA